MANDLNIVYKIASRVKLQSVIIVIRTYAMICSAKDLSADQKAAIETLLGRRVQEGESVSVRTFEPANVSHQRKLEIADELRKYFAEVDASRKPVAEDEAEDIITEAMRSVRPGNRPHR
jgi:Asp-tRNA(Asn)/Glu-tRNA(Gln) amidotransferase A subunit family amidase